MSAASESKAQRKRTSEKQGRRGKRMRMRIVRRRRRGGVNEDEARGERYAFEINHLFFEKAKPNLKARITFELYRPVSSAN